MKNVQNEYCILLVIYLSVVILKLFLSPFIPHPTIIGDEVTYLWMAEAPFYNQGNQYPFFYPFIISLIPSDCLQTTYLIAKAVNIFVSTSIIFPAYFLSKFFLSKQLSLIVGLFSLFIPVGFTYSFLIMSENLFYPLFLMSIYFIFKSEKEDERWLYLLSGIMIALTVLTRVIGLVLIVTYILYIIYKLLLNKTFDKHQIYTFIPILGITIPYLILNKVCRINSNLFGHINFGHAIYVPLKTTYLSISFFTYLMLGAGIILGIFSLVSLYNILKNREKTIFANFTIFSWICIITTIIISSIFLSGVYGIASRYIAFLIPLLFIIGFKSIDNYVNINKKIFLGIAFSIITISLLLIIPQNGETEILKCYFSTFKSILFIELLIILTFSFILFYSKFDTKKKQIITKYVVIGIIWFLLISGLSSEFTHRALSSQHTLNDEIIGKYIQNHNEKGVFDENIFYNDSSYISKNYFWRLKFWSDEKIKLGNTNSNDKFFVSSRNLSLPIVIQQELNHTNGNTTFYLYKL